MEEKKYTNEDLKIMQGWSLERKIQVTATRIIEWYRHYDGKCYVSFSGGKDSTVLADISAKVCKLLGYKLILWFSDTGLEYPEIRKHTKNYAEYIRQEYNIDVELVVDYPKDRKGKRITFKDVLAKYGYPLISKNQAQYISEYRHSKSDKLKNLRWNGNENGYFKISECHKYLVNAPFEITHKCCYVMKKKPAHEFNKQRGLTPIIGTMASESLQRKNTWKQNGCNAFTTSNPSSQPISFWTEQDVLKYIKDFNIPYASVYGDIIVENEVYKTTGCDRTGCVFCGFGCHLEKEPNKFQMLKQTHPKLWEYCMKSWDSGALGMKTVLDYINVKYE